MSYQKEVAPILQRYCLGCHNSSETEGGVSLHTKAAIQAGGNNGPLLSGDDPANSLLLSVLTSDGDDHMPPADELQPEESEIELIRQWLHQGAKFDGDNLLMKTLPPISPTGNRHQTSVFSLAFSRNGHQRFEGRFRSVHIANLSEGSSNQASAVVTVEGGKITSAQPDPKSDDSLLISTGIAGFSGRGLRISLPDGSIQTEFGGHTDIVYSIAATNDGRLIATAGYDRLIRIHDGQSGAILRTLTGHNGAIFDLSFCPDTSILASASADGTIKIWNAETGERFDTLSQPQAEQYACVFSPDGRFLYAAGADNRIRQWQLVSRTEPRINPLLEARFAHEAAISQISISGDGLYLATAAEDGSIKIWNSDSLTQIAVTQLQNDLPASLKFHPAQPKAFIGTISGKIETLEVPTETSSTIDSGSNKMSAIVLAADQPLNTVAEAEPNNAPAEAQLVAFPAVITGTISPSAPSEKQETEDAVLAGSDSDSSDYYAFAAVRGQQIQIEVRAAQDKSPLDSHIEVLTANGDRILQAQLQAVRDSYFTFRGKDSDTSDDFRMFNWREMELNQYLFSDGEVVKLWLYPRGPDSGFKVYPGFGKRYTYFGTTPTSHALQAPAFIVEPIRPGRPVVDNGLPVFPVFYENDDDPLRMWGSDSRLTFIAPEDATYIVRIRDARGFSGDEFRYQLTLRSPKPDFSIALGGGKVNVKPGTGQELSFTATRIDGYDGPIDLSVENLPAGFSTSLPTSIEPQQLQAFATILANDDANQPGDEAIQKVRFIAKATIDGKEISHEIGGLTELKLTDQPKITVSIHELDASGMASGDHSAELILPVGQTTRALLRVVRNGFDGNVEFGKEDAGRNLPHGVFVDNIGLNGLMLLPGQSEREIFITVANWVPEQSRMFYLQSKVNGITSPPVTVHIRR
ncbi:MAG: hypothetical protein KDA91_00420 [Planctomycetaceae bacterium]|nr:hypothetical protein [Planctomycetaceae bacterium]